MSTPTGSPTSGSSSAPTATSTTPASTTGRKTDASSAGKTEISDNVVSKIASLATREVSGVYGFGGAAARAFGAVVERIPGARASSSQGVAVEVGERQAAVDLSIVVEYGVAIVDLTRAVRRNVIGAIEQMTGLEVVEVNVSVVDMHLPTDDTGDDQAPARVQ